VLGCTVVHGFGLSARPSQGYGPARDTARSKTGRTLGVVTARGAHAVAPWPAARWCSTGDEVLLTSTRGSLGRCWAWSHEPRLTCVLGRRHKEVHRRRVGSSDRRRHQRAPAAWGGEGEGAGSPDRRGEARGGELTVEGGSTAQNAARSGGGSATGAVCLPRSYRGILDEKRIHKHNT
jgi:hypothetical protein